MKLSSPDYKGCTPEEAVADFLQRIECYKATYEPLDEQLDRWPPCFVSPLPPNPEFGDTPRG